MRSETKNCQNYKKDFKIESDDFNFYEKIKVPPPTFCPECRMIRRMGWRNNRSLHRRNCDLCGQDIITIYRSDADFPVFCNPCWFGDVWDAFSFSMDIDWSRPFLEQWFELFNKVPKFARWTLGNTKNSDYTNNLINSTDCYLSYSITDSEYILYSENLDKCKSLTDSYNCISCDSCYETQGLGNYMSAYLSQCSHCIDSLFLFDCVDCQNCFMSSNIHNKKYVFRNKQLSKEDYLNAIKNENLRSRQSMNLLKREWQNERKNALHKYARIVSAPNSTGDFVRDAKNIKYSFSIHDAENISYGIRIFKAKDSMDVYGLTEGELIYETVACSHGTYKNCFSINSNDTHNIFYSGMCLNGSDLFGCVGIRKNSYCILNKKYSKEEYEKLVPKIIDHMNAMPFMDKKGRVYKFGEFFPLEFSPFGYNESQSHDFFPLTKDEILEKGYNLYIPKEKGYKITIKHEDLPDSISETLESILNEVIECAHAKGGNVTCNQQCTTAFRITQNELIFIKKMNLPLPELCPNCRYHERLSIMIRPLKLWHRQCMCEKDNHHNHTQKCNVEFETSYTPDRPENIYCEKCYQQEVY